MIMMDILYQTCKRLASTDLTDLQEVRSIEEQIISAAMLANGWFFDIDENRYVEAMNKPERK